MTKRQQRERKEFQQSVIDMAHTFGWLAYFTYDSRRSPKGFPDLTLVNDRSVVFAELKVGDNTREPDQIVWGDALEQIERLSSRYVNELYARLGIAPYDRPPIVRYFLWYPANWPEIEHVLADGRQYENHFA